MKTKKLKKTVSKHFNFSPDEEVFKMREIIKDEKLKLEALNVDLTKNVSELERALHRWNDFEKGTNKVAVL